MRRLMAGALASVLLASVGVTKEKQAPLVIDKGARIGVVNLVDAELMHYHVARSSKESFMKIQAVNWSVNDMLQQALQGGAEQLGLTLVPLTPTDALFRARESCFVDPDLGKGLPKSCSAVLTEQAAGAGLNYLIVMAPGLNNSDHAGDSRIEGMPETMRGWGLFSSDRSTDKPMLASEIEMLLVTVSPDGVALRARQWGGNYSSKWSSYTETGDLKEITAPQLDQLQTLFTTMLSRQARGLVDQVHVGS